MKVRHIVGYVLMAGLALFAIQLIASGIGDGYK